MPEFKFNIGDLVVAKAAMADCESSFAIDGMQGTRAKVFMVCERLTQECHGGVQIKYGLSGGAIALEIELAPFSEYMAMLDSISKRRYWERLNRDLDERVKADPNRKDSP